MSTTRKPWWAQATPLVSVSAGGALIGFSFVPGTAAGLTSPTGLPHLLALDKVANAPEPARPEEARSAAAHADQALRSAVVNVAQYYLRMARTRTPAQMEAIIWGVDSVNGADHGASCAAFASMTLELGAQSVGQQSWVTGGGSYPWPLYDWADVRVDANPKSLGVISIQQDAQAHGRWHPVGDGYSPQPGDWVMFDQHVEVVTGYRDGVLSTIGANSLPDLTVNAHQFRGPLAEDGVVGFVDNGGLAAVDASASGTPTPAPTASAPTASAPTVSSPTASGAVAAGTAAIPGAVPAQEPAPAQKPAPAAKSVPSAKLAPAAKPAPSAKSGAAVDQDPAGHLAATGAADIPGAVAQLASTPVPAAPHTPAATSRPAAPAKAAQPAPYSRHKQPSPSTSVPETSAQQAFISAVAPGAMAAQSRYGIPAAVTIAQAIDESGWGQSELAAKDHNLFGIKGSGPAGTDAMPTQEFLDGGWVTTTAYFRMYHNVAESIADHSQLLATSPSYQRAMADRAVPDAFANDLTGVYATDPNYGSTLIGLMQLYDLYRYDDFPAAATATSPAVAAPVAKPPGAKPPAAKPPAAPVAKPPAAPVVAAAIPGATTAVLPAATVTAPTAIAPALSAPAAGGARVSRGSARIPGLAAPARAAARYQSQIPAAVTTAFINTARASIMTAKPLYRDVASFSGIDWQLLAACDWMQCGARPRYSPVHGEKLGSVNADGTVYHTKSAALAQCATDLVELSRSVYRIRLPGQKALSVTDLANTFAAFRWGGLLRQNNVSAMEFPYSVQGLTGQHTKMRWPRISAPDTPDRPGTRFRAQFGAVPIVLSLNYPATA
jgi:flagellum-specific peptidoglycan hydrolase FlgJ